MSKIIHDLTDTLPWVDGVKPKCRNHIGHYGDIYVLPIHCLISFSRRNEVVYGCFNYKSIKSGRGSTLTAIYSDDEPQAYERFMKRLAASSYCADICANQVKTSEAPIGEKTARLYDQLGLPKIYGVTIMERREKIRCLATHYKCQLILTYTHRHVVEAGKEAILQVFKEHLKKMPAEWLAKRHIPEIYLE